MGRDIGFTITVKGTEQQLKKIGLLEQQLKRLATQRTALLKKTKDGIALSKEEQIALGKLTTQSKKLQAQKSATLAQIKTENTLVKSTAGSYNRLVLENKKLTDAARKLSDPLGKNRKRFQELSSKISTNTDKLKKMDAAMGRSFRNVGNYSGAIGRLRGGFVAMGAAIAAGIIAFRTFTRLVGGSIKTLVDFDESMADVAKTTNLTADQIARLTDELKKLDTPTSINGLLAIAEAGGRLGVAEKDLLGFVEVTDKVVVALGDVLGTDPEAIGRSLGKVASLFEVDEAFGIAEAINKVGSSLNELGAQTKATEPFLIDFALRLGGIAPLAEIAIEDVLGLAATLDELGQPAETSATALGNLLLKLGTDVPTFAEIAGVSIDEFSNILREDANEALILVLEQVGQTGRGLENLAGVLEDAGIEGRRAAQIVGVLSNNTDLLRKNQDLATQSFAEGTSLTEEFNLKSATLGATFSKLAKIFTNKLLSTGLIDFLTNVGNLLTPAKSLTDQFLDMREEFEKNEEETDNLVRRYNELIGTTEDNEEGQAELEAVIRRLAELVPSAVTEFDKYGRALDINTGKVISNSEAQREILRAVNAQAIIELTQTIEDNTFKVDENNAAIARGTQLTTEFTKRGNLLTEEVELTDDAIAGLRSRMLAMNNESANALLELQSLGVELTEEQKEFVNTATEVEHFGEEIAEIATIVEETAFVTKKESESLRKQIEKNNATLLALNRELLEETIKLSSEGFEQERKLLKAQHLNEIADLEAQKGEVVAINDAIDALIEAKRKSHQAELTAINEEAQQDRNISRLAALDLEQQEALTAVAESEDTEKEKQQAILDIQIEFAEKRLQLLEETADITDEQVRLQIERLRTLLAELKSEAAEDELSGLAGFLNISEEDAQFLRDKSLQLAKQISDGIFDLQQKALARSTKARIDAINSEAKNELKILQDKLDKGLVSQEQFDKQSASIEDRADQRQLEAEKQAFRRGKVLAIAQAVVNGALAIMKILAQTGVLSPLVIPAAIAATATQVALIAAQKFEKGGELSGPSHSEGGIKAGGVEFEGGEGIINKRSMGSGDVLSVSGTPRDIASQINAYKGFGIPFGGAGRKKFQLGGVAPAPNIAPGGTADTAVVAIGPTFEETAELIAGALNVQEVQVVETDITDTQNDVAVIEELSS